MPHPPLYDVLVVGSGPAGASAARAAAKRGLRVLLVDKKQELGAPIQCSGAISAHALRDSGIAPSDEFISTSVFGFATYSADGEVTTIDYRALAPEKYGKKPLGYVVDRRRFDRHLMTLAKRAGAEAWLKTEALGYTPCDNGAVRVHLNRFGERLTVRARVIVGADGVQSQVGRWAGLKTHIKLSELASCLQLVVDGVEGDGLLEIVTGHQWAPGGYAWLFPKGHGYAEVGLGVIKTMTDKDAKWHLEHFMRRSFLADRLKNCRVLEVQGGGVPLTAPLKRQYADNVILVGDAARHVNPLTGGGIHTALRGGIVAGNFLADFFSTGAPLLAENLVVYQQRWLHEVGDALWDLYRLKSNIFRQQDIPQQDRMLYNALSGYFHPQSQYRKK